MRSIDHVVMPFETLGGSRDWFDRLGFTVAPDAVHPFGTGNACVFLADGRFIEPLAVVDMANYEAAEGEGHLFVMRDAAARALADRPGISALAFRSDDAVADREQLMAAGVGEEEFVHFERAMRLPDGGKAQLAFRLAFAKMMSGGAPNFFYCEARHRVQPDRSSLIAHRNGATGIARMTVASNDRDRALDYLMAVAGSQPQEGCAGSSEVPLAGGTLELVSGGARPLTIDSVTITVADLAFAKDFWQGQGVESSNDGEGVAVPCPNGRGVIRFIEVKS